jgi:hypothetical protein
MFNLVPTGIIVAAIAPALLLLWVAVAADRRPEPPLAVWTAFILGIVSIFVLRSVRTWTPLPIAAMHDPWLANAEYALLAVGLPEETIKIGLLCAFAWLSKAFNEPMDGVVYGAAIGLGFAAQTSVTLRPFRIGRRLPSCAACSRSLSMRRSGSLPVPISRARASVVRSARTNMDTGRERAFCFWLGSSRCCCTLASTFRCWHCASSLLMMP